MSKWQYLGGSAGYSVRVLTDAEELRLFTHGTIVPRWDMGGTPNPVVLAHINDLGARVKGVACPYCGRGPQANRDTCPGCGAPVGG